jgi:hypothetical protein
MDTRCRIRTMSPFHRSQREPGPEDADQAGWQADNARLDGLIDRLTALSSAQLAAELLEAADRADTKWARMPQYVDLISGERGDGDTEKFATVRKLWAEGFQALVIARLLALDEQATNKWGAGDIYDFVTRDGRAALDRGDVADVVARRLPD